MNTIDELQKQLTAVTLDIDKAIDNDDVREYLRLMKIRHALYADIDIARWQGQASDKPVAREGGEPCVA